MNDFIYSKLFIAIVSFIFGAVLSRLTMSKKERFDSNMKKQELSISLETEVTSTYQEYINALDKFNNTVRTKFDDFIEIEKAGAIYFNAINNLACAVMSNNVDRNSIKSSHLTKINEGYYRIIPQHYETLQYIANKCHFDYKGKFREENYKSMKQVIEKYP
ncbi:MAG: hypothetical protein CMK65_10465 [Pseudoalteromonas sp.]|uniref:hypothetical protein n=1 Tax=Pseudoalteromonas sp. TaxID=53249 RepID=UPI000C95FB07|nr:hypothetical protein [Pseudoalteromonas sp.]MAD04028.1 hypothetical protein [Pseudoalteromonas sp.]|tara:strand:+ start:5342 stop:5824 length:483 start_codon:yes stop_codon:yes gene_type:complete